MSQAKELMRRGYPFVCACCSKLHRGLRVGFDGCEAAIDGLECGGPLLGLSFPHYEGPLTRPTIAKHCFRCGAAGVKLLETADGGFLAVCDAKPCKNMVHPNDNFETLVPDRRVGGAPKRRAS